MHARALAHVWRRHPVWSAPAHPASAVWHDAPARGAARAQWGADYFLEGIRYSPDGAEFLESIGRMAPPDVDLLGDDADAGASTTLDESFADLDGSRPAQVPALGAEGAPRERDALDPPAAGGADAARSARCAPLAMQAEPLSRPRAVQAALGGHGAVQLGAGLAWAAWAGGLVTYNVSCMDGKMHAAY